MLAQHQEITAVTKAFVQHQCMNPMGNQDMYSFTYLYNNFLDCCLHNRSIFGYAFDLSIYVS